MAPKFPLWGWAPPFFISWEHCFRQEADQPPKATATAEPELLQDNEEEHKHEFVIHFLPFSGRMSTGGRNSQRSINSRYIY